MGHKIQTALSAFFSLLGVNNRNQGGGSLRDVKFSNALYRKTLSFYSIIRGVFALYHIFYNKTVSTRDIMCTRRKRILASLMILSISWQNAD